MLRRDEVAMMPKSETNKSCPSHMSDGNGGRRINNNAATNESGIKLTPPKIGL